MTVPATAEPQAPPRTVRVPITEPVILGHMLQLDGHLAGAQVEWGTGGATLVLYVDYPGAPEGEHVLTPEYARHVCRGQASCPGQYELDSLNWSRG